MPEKLNAFGVDDVAAEGGHGNFWRSRLEAIDEDRVFGVTGDEVVTESAGVSGGVGRFAETLMGEVGLAKAKVDAGVSGLAAGLMAVGAVGVEVGASAVGDRGGSVVPARGFRDRVGSGETLQVADAGEMRELVFRAFSVGEVFI